MDSKLLSIREAGKARGIGYHTISRLVREGKLTAVWLPGRQFALIDIADLDRLIKASKVGPKAGPETSEDAAELCKNPAQFERGQIVPMKTATYQKGWEHRVGSAKR